MAFHRLSRSAGARSSLRDNLRSGTLDDRQQFFLLLVWNLEPIERRFEVADYRIKFWIAYAHPRVSSLDLLAVIFGRSATGDGNKLTEVLFQSRNVFRCCFPHERITPVPMKAEFVCCYPFPLPVDAGIFQNARHEIR